MASPVTANAGPTQTYPYSQLPKLVTLDGSGTSSSGGAIIAYKWYRLYRPAGSSAVLSDDEVVGPTFTMDVAGSYLFFLEAQDVNSAWSERNPLKAPNSAFVLITARTQAMDLTFPAGGQRNYTEILLSAMAELEVAIGAADAHMSPGANKHTDDQITYTRADGSKKNIGAGDDNVRQAIDKLDDTIALLSTLTTTAKTSVVAAINELVTKTTTGAISNITSSAGDSGKLIKLDAAGKIDGRDPSVDGAILDAAVAASAGAGDSGKLVKLNGAGILAATIHGVQSDTTLHALSDTTHHGFMSSTGFNKLASVEFGADVTSEANVLAALAASTAEKDMGGGKVSNIGTPVLANDAVNLVSVSHGGNGVHGKWLPDGEQLVAIENTEVVATNDIVEFRAGARCRKAAAGSSTVIGVAQAGGTGDAGGTVKARVKDRGIFALVVENGANTTVGRRVKVSATANQIEQASAVEGSFGIAMETVAGNGALTCKVLLQSIGVIA